MSNQALSEQETAQGKTVENNTAATEPKKGLMEVTLDGAIALSKERSTLPQATEQFNALMEQVNSEAPSVAPLLKQLWSEYVAAQRSAAFYERLSDAEKELSDKLSESTVQLKRNYMRLIQEQ
ncbi:MAG: hypothetical protein AAFU53_11125 [Cyanobacteria bacterium J06632_3]